MEINVQSDVKDITRYLTSIQKKQVPFSTALALTRTAEDAQRATHRQLPQKIDKPVPFTFNRGNYKKGAIGITGARKTRLWAEVFVKDIQARYLKWAIFGGRRKPRGKGTAVPVNVKLNQYGNIPGRRRKSKLWRQGKTDKPTQFIATIRGVYGLWERVGPGRRRVKLLARFEKAPRYNRRFPFFRIAERTINNQFSKNFYQALERALRTAR